MASFDWETLSQGNKPESSREDRYLASCTLLCAYAWANTLAHICRYNTHKHTLEDKNGIGILIPGFHGGIYHKWFGFCQKPFPNLWRWLWGFWFFFLNLFMWFVMFLDLCIWAISASLKWSKLAHSNWWFWCVLEFNLQVFCTLVHYGNLSRIFFLLLLLFLPILVSGSY